MEFTFHADPQRFVPLATQFYAQDPLRHTVALTVMARVVATGAASTPPVMASLHDGSSTIGVALRTPPWPVISSGLPLTPAVLDEILPRWLEHDPELSGASGPRKHAEAVAAAWVRLTGGAVTETVAGRLFRLGTVTPPVTTGAARPATRDDLDLLIRWRLAFEDEAIGRGHPEADIVASVGRMFDIGDSLLLWEDGGEPVAWAVASKPIRGMSRVGPVYTPPERRGRGYGSAVSAAVSSAAVGAGARDVVLFTDLANPVSNSIYRRIGYRPVYDSTELRFSRLPSTS